MTTGCDPCKITVRPPRIGHVFEYVRTGFNPELKKPYGLVVKPGNFGSVIETCQISAFGVAGQGPPPVPVTVVSILAAAGNDYITIFFDHELDPTCSFTDGVTITVDGTPVNIVGATSDGSSDPWGYQYQIGPVNSEPAVSGYSVWLNPDTLDTTTTPGFVEGWANDSSASRGSQADMSRTGATMPVATAAGFNVARSEDLTSRYLLADSPFTISTSFCIFLVGRWEGSASSSALIDSPSLLAINRPPIFQIAGNISIQAVNIGILTVMAEAGGSGILRVYGARFQQNNYRAKILGDVDDWVDTASATDQDFQYGQLLQSALGNQADGWVGEVIIYESGLTDAQLTSVFDALDVKWSYTDPQFGDSVVWDYDAGTGEICSSTTTLGSTTETTTVECTLTGSESTIVSWNAELDSPTINGAVYSNATDNVTVSDAIASTVDLDLSSQLLYSEFEVLAIGTKSGISNIGAGWKFSGTPDNATSGRGVIVFWQEFGGVGWRINTVLGSQSLRTFDVQVGDPDTCVNFGIAIDLVNDKAYCQMNGSWMTSNLGTLGGDPSGGNGWDITWNPGIDNEMILWSYIGNLQDSSLRAVKPSYTPSGYTAVT